VSHEPIDLLHLGQPRSVGCFVVETDDGLALFDCGPATCLPVLRAALQARGLRLEDLRHILLSHIHLDHAGAAGAIVAAHPEITVHVSEIGAPHLIDPSRLEASARRLYGDRFDSLWGEVTPVPERNLRVVGSRVLGLACFPTPGHARHHVSYVHEDGTLYAGDAAGVRVAPERHVVAPTPPPEIDLDAWEATIDTCLGCGARRLALIHFGVFDDVAQHLERLRLTLRLWGERVRQGMDASTFTRLVREDLGEVAPLYEVAMTIESCHAGLERYWRKAQPAGSRTPEEGPARPQEPLDESGGANR
jgi:glyoxylase-like metal-dependent hydrolase (beta-lactamase superfamily II)